MECCSIERGPLANFFPNLGQAVAVDAEIPLTEVTEWRGPDVVSGLPQASGECIDECFSRRRGGGFAPEVGKGMNHDVLELSFVREPLDMLQRLPQYRRQPIFFCIRRLRMEENDDGFRSFAICSLICYLGQRF